MTQMKVTNDDESLKYFLIILDSYECISACEMDEKYSIQTYD